MNIELSRDELVALRQQLDVAAYTLRTSMRTAYDEGATRRYNNLYMELWENKRLELKLETILEGTK